MAFPAGATTRNVAFSNPIDAENGTQYSCRAIVTCNKTLIHIATGVVVVPVSEYRDPPNFPLMVTDQLNTWRDEVGNTLSESPTHSYCIDLEFLNPKGVWVPYRSIPELLVPSGAGDYDIDLVVLSKTRYSDV